MADATIRDARDEEFDAVGDLIVRAYAEFGPPRDAPPELKAVFDEYVQGQRNVRGRAPL